jgi:hypothetical protein
VFSPTLELATFDTLPIERRREVLVRLLEVLAFASQLHLRAHPDTPSLYEAARVYGQRYEAQPPPADFWRDIPRSFIVRSDDCVGLSVWRVADLRERFGEPGAGFVVTSYEAPHACSTNPDAPCLIDYHVQVKRQDGRIEDPSYALGMVIPPAMRA